MAIQLLKNCRVAINRGGTIYPLDALGDISMSSSIAQTSIPRKTLFNNTSRPLMVTSKINPTSISLTLNVAQYAAAAGILLELVGLSGGVGGYEYLQNTGSPELFELVILNRDTVISATPCYMESIDISLSKGSNLIMDCTISAANIQVDIDRDPIHNIEYQAVAHTPISLKIGGVTQPRVRSASISVQQDCEWRNDKNLFTGNDTYVHSLAILNDRIVSANATVNFNDELINTAVIEHLEIEQSGLKLVIENARITSNFDLGSTYSVRYDCYVTEESGLVLLTLDNTAVAPEAITYLTYGGDFLSYNGAILTYNG